MDFMQDLDRRRASAVAEILLSHEIKTSGDLIHMLNRAYDEGMVEGGRLGVHAERALAEVRGILKDAQNAR